MIKEDLICILSGVCDFYLFLAWADEIWDHDRLPPEQTETEKQEAWQWVSLQAAAELAWQGNLPYQLFINPGSYWLELIFETLKELANVPLTEDHKTAHFPFHHR